MKPKKKRRGDRKRERKGNNTRNCMQKCTTSKRALAERLKIENFAPGSLRFLIQPIFVALPYRVSYSFDHNHPSPSDFDFVLFSSRLWLLIDSFFWMFRVFRLHSDFEFWWGFNLGPVGGVVVGIMKFGETFMEYLHGEQESFLDKFSHVEYKRLKKVLKSCRSCRALHGSCGGDVQEDDSSDALSGPCQLESCPREYLPIYDTFYFL